MNGFRIMQLAMRLVSEAAHKNRPRFVIEILMGTVSILLIAAVAIPVYVNDNRHSPVAGCLSHVKQVTLGQIMYASDHDEQLPPYFTFDSPSAAKSLVAVTLPYVKDPRNFLCDQDVNALKNGSTQIDEGVQGTLSYVHSLALKGLIPTYSEHRPTLNPELVMNPETIALMRDPIRGYGTGLNAQGALVDNVFLSPHQSRFVVSYLDGHVKSRNPIDQYSEL